MPSINEQEVRYVYQVDGSGVMVSNPIEPSYYMRRYAVVELSREFLLEGTPEKLYFTEIVATFKPFSEQLLEGNSPNNFVLEEHQRDSFQWLPWERLQDEQQWLAKERRNTAVILAQEELFCQQAIKAFQDYLATTTQPTIAAAQEAVVTSLERDWYMSDFTMIAKSNNW